MIDLIPLVVYLACLAGLMWMHNQKMAHLEGQVDAQERIVTALALALHLHLHLDGRSVSMHMIPIRTDEEE